MTETIQTIPPPPRLKILTPVGDDNSGGKSAASGAFGGDEGGAKTKIEAALVGNGGYSMIQNMRFIRPGLMQRYGQIVLHTSPDGSNQAVSAYRFKKSNGSEQHFFAQFSDGDVLEATNIPPTVTSGAFGSEVFSGSSGQGPASWSTHKDMMVYSNGGADQHQIYAGDANELEDFVKCVDHTLNPIVDGVNYLNEIKSTNTSDYVSLDNLGSSSSVGYFIRTSVPANKLTLALSEYNGSAAVTEIKYWNGSFTAVSGFSDGTSAAGKTMANDGDMTWTAPSDEEPYFLYGQYGFWYLLYLSSGDLDATVRLDTLTFGSDWQSIRNVWDNKPVLPDDVVVTAYNAYGADSVVYTCDPSAIVISDVAEIGTINAGTSGSPIYGLQFKVEFSSKKPLRGYSISLDERAMGWKNGLESQLAHTWRDGAWFFGGTVYRDGRADQSGWTVFNNSFNPSLSVKYDSTDKLYWYRITFGVTQYSSEDGANIPIVWPDETMVIELIPRYDIADIGTHGLLSTSWKDRMAYVFAESPYKVHVSSSKNPFYLNGNDYSELPAGDGRRNRIKCIKEFYNELMVFQEELGTEGGCITLFTGNSPGTYSKSMVSYEVGTFNNKSAVVVDSIAGKRVYFISNRGIYESNGNGVIRISEDIQNYFDPNDSNCLRRGYENQHWIAYDSVYDIIRIGMVCGSSATVPNIFLIYDIAKQAWGFDTLGQPLSFISNADAGSGNVDVLSVGGGVDDGTVYLLNSGTNDVSTAIDAYVKKELNLGGLFFTFDGDMIFRMKAQTAGDVVITPYTNGVAESTITKSMIAKNSGETTRRHRVPLNRKGSHISLKFRNNTASQSLYLLDNYIPLRVQEGK